MQEYPELRRQRPLFYDHGEGNALRDGKGRASPLWVQSGRGTAQRGCQITWQRFKVTLDDKTGILFQGNYRPLSILSIPSKIVESCVKDAIIDHVPKSNRLVTENQWAYRKGYSTELLVDLTEIWTDAIDSGLVVNAAFIDFKKAFHCVDHAILLNKLQCQFGISGLLFNWLTSYLTSRLQYAVLNGQRSRFCSATSGVPQGSVLGPTLFVFYTSDLVESFWSGTVRMYADHTTMYSINLSLVNGRIRPLLALTYFGIRGDAIIDHVLNSNLLVTQNQWAYRKGYSTELLVDLTEIWRDAIDSGLVVNAAFIDSKKAFDCVDHAILLNKLQCQFGTSGFLLNWLTSYLTSRQQYTVLNGQRSRFCSTTSGVPHGSVLGPTLFVLYTSYLVPSWFLRCVLCLIFSLDLHRFFAKKLASSIGLPFKNGGRVRSIRWSPRTLHKRCSWGSCFRSVGWKWRRYCRPSWEWEDVIYEENDSPSSNSGDSNAESDRNGMCFLFVCLSNRFYKSIFASHVISILSDSIDMNIWIQWNFVTIFYHQMIMLFVIVAQLVTQPLIDKMWEEIEAVDEDSEEGEAVQHDLKISN